MSKTLGRLRSRTPKNKLTSWEHRNINRNLCKALLRLHDICYRQSDQLEDSSFISAACLEKACLYSIKLSLSWSSTHCVASWSFDGTRLLPWMSTSSVKLWKLLCRHGSIHQEGSSVAYGVIGGLGPRKSFSIFHHKCPLRNIQNPPPVCINTSAPNLRNSWGSHRQSGDSWLKETSPGGRHGKQEYVNGRLYGSSC